MASKEVVKTVTSTSGRTYKYVWTNTPSSGAMKYVYFSPDKSYVVAFFKEPQNAQAIDRLESLVGKYRERVFDDEGGDYWKNIYCWPNDLIKDGDKVGLIVPAYNAKFFFKNDGSNMAMKGFEKESKWFTSPDFHFGLLSEKEIGDWRSFFNISFYLAKGVNRLHMAGLAHSDLSYKNVLIDPVTSSATIIDIDGLVVPGKYPPDVLGTPDFIAPEVYETMSLPKKDPRRKLPCQETDRHALAVLIYMYLLYRHPLDGRQFFDLDDPQKEKQLMMGTKAVFIEDPKNRVNRYDLKWVQNNYPKSKWPKVLPWLDLDKLPYTILGTPLKKLFDRAFVDGLHNPSARPAAFEWVDALIQTMDMLIPCQNPKCKQKWFVFDKSVSSKPKCPFCGQEYKIPAPVLMLHNKWKDSYKPTNTYVVVYDGMRLFQWHSDPAISRNEKLTVKQREPIAYFQFFKGCWYLRNQLDVPMLNMKTQQSIGKGVAVPIHDNDQIRLGGENARMISVQMVNK